MRKIASVIMMSAMLGAGGSALAADGASGEEIYNSKCKVCHATGVANSPKLGDKAAWEPRIAQGMDTLYANSVKGIRAMPPKGTCMDCSEADLKAAVDYMVGQSK